MKLLIINFSHSTKLWKQGQFEETKTEIKASKRGKMWESVREIWE